MRILCVLFQKPAPISEFAEACYRITPQVALREGEGVFLEIEQCRRLYSENTIVLKVQALLKRFGVQGCVAVADDVFMSLVKARFGKTELETLPLEALHDFASPFKAQSDEQRKISEMIEILKSLGLKNVDDFLKLPLKQVTSRFQKQGVDIYSRLLHGGFEESLSLWPKFIPPDHILESVSLEGQDNCHTLEPLLFVAKNIISRAMARLAGKGERASRVAMRFELEKYSTVKEPVREWSFDLPLSQGSVHGILPLIREKLNFDLAQKPFESAVIKMEFKILETVPGQYFQRHFFNKKEEEQEAWNSLITRLCEKLGRSYAREENTPAFVAEAVQTYAPEKAWRRTVTEKLDLANLVGIDLPLPSRPLRLLKTPQRLKKEGNALVSEEDTSWDIRDWEGPECITGEWWGEELKRDYFRVGTSQGEELWVFRIPNSDQIFLHGYFD